MSFSGDQSWLHGLKQAPVTMVASREPANINDAAPNVIVR
jgi:hypothetical protein